MQHFPALPALHTPRLSGPQAASALTLAFASGGDDDSAALADLFANLGAQADSDQPRSAAAAELHAALLGQGRKAAAQLS
jgi:hypothetical protein